MTERVDVLVIGAGVVGLAIARHFAQQGRGVVVLEAEDACGTQTSARSSEVVHAGLYYPAGSLKARLCVAGRELLLRYADERGVSVKRCGKLLVANGDEETAALQKIAQLAVLNGVTNLQWLEPAAARLLEPAVRCTRALLSPSTAIVDSHALIAALIADIESAGGIIALQTTVTGWSVDIGGMLVDTTGANTLALGATLVINAAGHGAPRLLHRLRDYPRRRIPSQYFAKGSYFRLRGPAPFTHLIYPVPEPGGLGVHATLDQAGGVRFGPDVEWVDSEHDVTVNPERAPAFEQAIRRFWPDLPHDSLVPDYAGVRPKLDGPDAASADFRIEGPEEHGVRGVINLLGIESPGLTACLAIAAHVAALV